MKRVLALYAVSGFLSLGYQVAWLRIHVDRFGSTDLTFVLVLCSFIGALGLGALASRRVAAWLARRALRAPLRQYGAVELAVCAAALLTFAAGLVPADLFGPFPYVLRDGIYEPTAARTLAKVALAVVCVATPCFFMGVTFPLLCHAFRSDARFPSLLYAWNTLGACMGVLASEFALIPWLGHERMFAALVAVNGALGAYFLAAGGGIAARGAAAEAAPPAAAPARRVSYGALLTCAIVSGAVAGTLEADLFKRVSFLGIRTSTAMSFISFWAVLAIFCGSAAVRALPRLSLGHQKLALTAAIAIYSATVWNVFGLHEWAFGLLAPSSAQDAPLPMRFFFPSGLAPLFLFVGVLVFPAFALVSLLLPWACNQLQGEGRHLGLAYGSNTVAFCLATIAFTWVAPRVSIFYALKLSLVTMALGAGLVWLIGERARLAPWKPLAATAGLLAGCALVPAGFDRDAMLPRTQPTVAPVRAVMSDSSYTTFVVEDPAGDALYFDNVSLSNASLRSQTYMGLMAHFPLLAHPAPRDVLLICYGVGNTAGAISTHETVRAIDVVDLSRNVMLTAPEFAETNEGVHTDPRVRFIHDDGRAYLATTDRRYDLVTSEPPPPLHTGVYRLYSREYYRDVLAHLTPGGMMSQWLPVQQMPQRAVDLAVRTFLDVFPHALLFSGMREDLVLVGSESPIALATLERRFGESPRMARHLRKLRIPDASALLARLVQGDASLRRRYAAEAGTRVVTDRHNDLAHVFLDPGDPGVVPYDPAGVLAEIADEGLESEALLREVFRHLGRLQHHARGFPVSSLAALREGGGGGVAGAEVDWARVARLEQRALEHRDAGRREAARAALREALALAPEQPKLLARLASVELALGAPRGALAAMERYVALEPQDAAARAGLERLRHRLADRNAEAEAPRRVE